MDHMILMKDAYMAKGPMMNMDETRPASPSPIFSIVLCCVLMVCSLCACSVDNTSNLSVKSSAGKVDASDSAATSIDGEEVESINLENCTWSLPSAWIGKVDVEYNDEGDGAWVSYRKTGQMLFRFQMFSLQGGYENIPIGPEERLYVVYKFAAYGRGVAVVGNSYGHSVWDELRDAVDAAAADELLSLQTGGTFCLADAMESDDDSDVALSVRFETSARLFIQDHIRSNMRF